METSAKRRNRLASVFSVQTIVLASALVLAALMAAALAKNPDQAKGYEAYWIAQSLAGGHGYSSRCAGFRWSFDDIDRASVVDALEFCPTAWVEPVYTFLLAALIRATGDWDLLAGAILNLVLFVVAVMLTFRLARNYECALAGGFAAALFSASLYFQAHEWFPLNNTLLATVFVTLFALALHRAVRTPSRMNIVVLGLATGFAILAYPGAIGFLPVATVFVAIAKWPSWSSAVSKSALVFFVSIMVLVPWATRNYLVFGGFVPVRTGAGLNAFIGTVAPGGTVERTTLRSSLDPPWRASTAKEAIATAGNYRALLEFQAGYAREIMGNSWSLMNEAQRDRWLQQEVTTYLLQNPLLSMKLAFWKLHAFAQCMGWFGTLLVVLALVGGILAVAGRRLDLLALFTSFAAFTAPFILIVPYFQRYRIPIEPILASIASLTLWQLVRFYREGRLTVLSSGMGIYPRAVIESWHKLRRVFRSNRNANSDQCQPSTSWMR